MLRTPGVASRPGSAAGTARRQGLGELVPHAAGLDQVVAEVAAAGLSVCGLNTVAF
ncbi:MAG: hypothetical protein R3F24_05755 [Gammaproteobacteria bacterium]